MGAMKQDVIPFLSSQTKIMVAANEGEHLYMLQNILQEAGFENSMRGGNLQFVSRLLEQDSAALLVYYAEQVDEMFFQQLRKFTQQHLMPIVVFTDRSDAESILTATRLGVHGFIVNGLEAGRIEAILIAAIARFEELRAIKSELQKVQKNLDERKLIERAKGLLIDKHKMSESEAYSSLRKMAMDQGKTIAEVAGNIISMFRIIG